MQVTSGKTIGYREYMSDGVRQERGPVAWRWWAVEDALTKLPHDNQGTVALTDPHSIEPSSLAPGLSMVVQVLVPGESTKSHSHSFWHLYFVRSGRGYARLGTDAENTDLAEGDILYVPAWCPHSVANAGDLPLVMLRMQNLPENARLGTLARAEGGLVQHIYAESAHV